MKTIPRATRLAAALTLLAGCATTPPAPPVAADPTVLRVGVTPNAPPVIFKQDGEIAGIEADLAQALGGELGRRVVFVESKFDGLIDALCENQMDIIMSGMTITTTRSYRIAFSDPWLKTGQMALVRADEKFAYLINLEARAKRGVGVEKGTSAELLMHQNFPRAKVKYFASGEAAAAALLNKDVDLFVSDAPLIWYLVSLFESKGLTLAPTSLTEEFLGWGVRRTDPGLRDAANGFLKKIQQNGEYNRVLRRWIPNFQ